MIFITDFEMHACDPETTTREILARINRSPHLFQVVVDDAGRLCGTITDGDIRRAMLHGGSLDAPARTCMQPSPVIGRVGDGEANFGKLRNTGSSRAFLPLVDDEGILREIYVAEDDQNAGIRTALVMAGGLGTRLGERTRDTPKPLLHVGGRPILDHLLERLEASGIGTILVSVHYLADKVEDFIKQRKSRAKIEVVREPSRLGTAGAIGRLDPLAPREPLLVVNGDVLTRVEYAALHDFHFRHGLDATIGVTRHEIDIPFGVVRYGADGMFAGIEEKPRIVNFVAAGVYYLSPEITALVPADRPMDMPELLNLGREIGLKIGLFPIHEYWADVGRPDDLERAEAAYRSRDVQTK